MICFLKFRLIEPWEISYSFTTFPRAIAWATVSYGLRKFWFCFFRVNGQEQSWRWKCGKRALCVFQGRGKSPFLVLGIFLFRHFHRWLDLRDSHCRFRPSMLFSIHPQILL